MKYRKEKRGKREAKWGKIGEKRRGVGKEREVRGNPCTMVLPLSLKAGPSIPKASGDGAAAATLSSVHICNSFWSSSSQLWFSSSILRGLLGGAMLLVDPKKLAAAQCVPSLWHWLHCCNVDNAELHLSRGVVRSWVGNPKWAGLHSAHLCSTFPAPGPPSFLAFSEITSTTLNVSWGEPSAANGILQGYRVVYEPLAPVQGKVGAWHSGLYYRSHRARAA